MTQDDLDRPVGVWRAVGDFRLKDMLWPEGVLALLIGGGGAALILGAASLSSRTDIMGDVLALAGAFLAVVFTALAIVVSLPSNSYLRMLGETPNGGMRRFLDPFLVAVGTQVALILLCIAYRLVATDVPSAVEHGAFGFIAFLFVFGLLDIAALARQLVRHGILRATDAMLDANGHGGNGGEAQVRRLPRSGS